MRTSLARRVATVAVAAAGTGLLIGLSPLAHAGSAPICADGDLRVYVTQVTSADSAQLPVTGLATMNAVITGEVGHKYADFHWQNLTTGASGDADGWGHGPAGASAVNVPTGAGQIRITADYSTRDLNGVEVDSAQCTGTVTIV